MTAPLGGVIGGVYAACRVNASVDLVSRLNVASVLHGPPGSGQYAITLSEGIDDADCAFSAAVEGPAASGAGATVQKTGNATFLVQVSTSGGPVDAAFSLLVARTNIG